MFDMLIDKSFNNKVDQKSNDIANQARITGNDRFSGENYFYALNHYNRSITYAKTKNVAALAYGNRSAVYFTLKLYKECLENIQLARENEYPADKMSKLNEREAKCKELMTESKDKKIEDIWDFFELSYPANEKIPWLVDCVELRKTEKYGRGIYAKQDLKAGDIICVEDPFFNFIIKEDIYNTYLHCYNCHKCNKMNLIPCDKTASMMFCSIDCKENFYAKAIDINKMLCADVKLLSDVAEHFGGVKAFDDYIKRTNLNTLNKTIFDYDLSNPEDPDYKDKLINCFLSLSTNKNRLNEDCFIRKLLSEKTSHHLLSIYNLNHRDLMLEDSGRNTIHFGHYISLFTSLINHSCMNNAFSMNVGNKIVTILEKPVKAGQQIFFRYGKQQVWLPFYGLEKETHLAKHNFKCDCEACKDEKESFIEGLMHGAGMNDNKMMYEIAGHNPIYEENYDLGKEKLKKYFDDVNENPDEHKIASVPLLCCKTIFKSAAYMLTYSVKPFNPYKKN